jgi:hypothetical protein
MLVSNKKSCARNHRASNRWQMTFTFQSLSHALKQNISLPKLFSLLGTSQHNEYFINHNGLAIEKVCIDRLKAQNALIDTHALTLSHINVIFYAINPSLIFTIRVVIYLAHLHTHKKVNRKHIDTKILWIFCILDFVTNNSTDIYENYQKTLSYLIFKQ